MSADLTPMVPATTHAKVSALLSALDLPDVTDMAEVKKLDNDSRVEFVFMMEQALLRANALFREACSPAVEAVANARGHLVAAIPANAKALPHPMFDVRLEQKKEPEKRIDVLRRLEGLLPDDLYNEAVFIKGVDVSQADPKAVDAVIKAGGKPTWDANLTKLNKHARDFGGDIAAIIEEGSPRVEVGAPRLVIEPRASALKAVGKS
jgi:hypothetical protein